MSPGPLTLIGSGEFSERLLNLHQTLLRRLDPPQIAFLDTPAGFQLNAAELSAIAAAYFKKHFNLDIAIASYRNSAVDPALAINQLLITNYLLAGPGSPTYAVNHWRGSAVWQTLVQRWNAGAQLVFASSAAIALSRYALPVYEIYKVGADPLWAEGLHLLGPLGFDLAIIPHYNNAEGRTHDTRYCFMGEPRLHLLEKLLPPTTVILGIDENTAATLDFDSQIVTVTGAGAVTLRYTGREVQYPNGAVFPLDRLKPDNALTQPPTLRLRSGQVSSLQSPLSPSSPSSPTPPHPHTPSVPARVIEWAAERDRLRAEKKFAEADQLRNRISAVGYAVKDSPSGPLFTLTRLPNPNAVPSKLDGSDSVEWSINLLAHNNRAEILRVAQSALKWRGDRSIEVVIVDNGSDDGTAEAIAELAADDERARPVYLASDAGEGAGRNAGFRSSGGRFIMLLGGHVEIAGDVFTPLAASLQDESVGAAGSHGLVSADLFTFNPAPTKEADAIEFYLFAFRRSRLKTVGLLDEKFVFYRNLDLDWSLAFKDKGLRLIANNQLPITIHEHPYLRMDPAERDRLSKKNYRRFLDKWRDRKDLLLVNG